MRVWVYAVSALAMTMGVTAQAKIPDSWDGLMRVESKKLTAVYLMPGADFRGYTKVMIDKPEIAFQKNWQRDYNREKRDLSGRVRDSDITKAITEGSAAFDKILRQAYEKAGYQVVDQPGADVMRLSTAVVNISVNAPDIMTAGITRSYSSETGEATLVVEARDSVTGALMGRALDRTVVGDNTGFIQRANSVTNRADFELTFRQWGKEAAEGLTKLKAMSPIDGEARKAP